VLSETKQRRLAARGEGIPKVVAAE
jgi:hypothetical protein